MEEQCQNYIAHDPYHPRCARGLALMYRQLGEIGYARKWMRYYLDHAVEADPEANQIYGRLIADGR